MSDLHLEYHPHVYVYAGEDVLVLAGDIGPYDTGINWALREVPKHVQILYVPGNHEYYHLPQMRGFDIPKVNAYYRYVNRQGTNLKVLLDDTFEKDDVVFVGTTLFSDFTYWGQPVMGAIDAMRGMWDFKLVRRKNKPLIASDWEGYNRASRRFLRKIVKNKVAGKTYVLITHFCAELSVHPRFAASPHNAGFQVKLPMNIINEFKWWFHGHTHDSFDYAFDQCRVVCNPKGNQREFLRGHFDEKLVLEI